jgi:AI-2E family transporter/regulatory LuxR family protein
MSLTRPILFWIAMLAALIAAVVLLREVLLPFVAGMVLAYLLDPLATRLERLGINRLIATLTIVGLFIVGVVALIVLTAPIIVRELAYFIDNFPLYVRPFPFSRFDTISDSVDGFGDVLPIATLRWNAGVHNYMTYITGDIPVGCRCSTDAPSKTSAASDHVLSPREESVIKLIAEGHGNKKIADVLSISLKTVKVIGQQRFAN